MNYFFFPDCILIYIFYFLDLFIHFFAFFERLHSWSALKLLIAQILTSYSLPDRHPCGHCHVPSLFLRPRVELSRRPQWKHTSDRAHKYCRYLATSLTPTTILSSTSRQMLRLVPLPAHRCRSWLGGSVFDIGFLTLLGEQRHSSRVLPGRPWATHRFAGTRHLRASSHWGIDSLVLAAFNQSIWNCFF